MSQRIGARTLLEAGDRVRLVVPVASEGYGHKLRLPAGTVGTVDEVGVYRRGVVVNWEPCPGCGATLATLCTHDELEAVEAAAPKVEE